MIIYLRVLIYLLALLAWLYIHIALVIAVLIAVRSYYSSYDPHPLWKSYLAALVWPLPWFWKYL